MAVEHFAQLSTGELTTLLVAIFAGFGSLLVGFYAFAQKLLQQARDERDKERKEFTSTLKDLADSNREIAEATKRGNKESKIRNGHLGDQNIKLAEMQKETAQQILEAISHIKNQQVLEQTVEHQHIENKE